MTIHSGAVLILLAVIGGALVAGQGAINGRMAQTVGHPLLAAVLSFSVGLTALIVLSVVSGQGLSNLGQAVRAPWWAWLGGFLGAYLVATAAMAVPRIGAGAWVSGVIAGQLCAALIYDHFGAFGLERRPIDLSRLLAVGFLVSGVVLMRRP